jgi:pSer/pThr/pTyr-binding forkhead associated (FHA) protein
MDLTLRVISGPDKEHVFSCAAPETFIGRSQRCAVRLASPAISFEHVLITRKGDEFYVENLSANGTLLNNERLGSAGGGGGTATAGAEAKMRLRLKDTIQIGADTVLRVEGLPAVASSGTSRRWLLVVLLLMMLVAGAVVMLTDPFSDGPAGSADWSKAYPALQQFAQEQADEHLLPPEFPGMLRDAWRLHISGDKFHEADQWKRLVVLLDYWDRKLSVPDDAVSAHFLQAVAKGQAPNLSQEGRAALKHFITIMSHRR